MPVSFVAAAILLFLSNLPSGALAANSSSNNDPAPHKELTFIAVSVGLVVLVGGVVGWCYFDTKKKARLDERQLRRQEMLEAGHHHDTLDTNYLTADSAYSTSTNEDRRSKDQYSSNRL